MRLSPAEELRGSHRSEVRWYFVLDGPTDAQRSIIAKRAFAARREATNETTAVVM